MQGRVNHFRVHENRYPLFMHRGGRRAMDRIRIFLLVICILGCVQLLAAGVSGEIFSSDRMYGFNAVPTGDFSLVAGTTGTTLPPLLTCTTGDRAGSREVRANGG